MEKCKFYSFESVKIPSKELSTEKRGSDYRRKQICEHPDNSRKGMSGMINANPRCKGDTTKCTYSLMQQEEIES